jgi:hypothetical protein
MARKSSTNKNSGATLRAMRDARTAVDPKVEAQRRETSLLKSLTTAREDFDWFVSNRAWEPLGHETFTSWWLAKVQPVADGLMKPVREVARAAIDIMTEEQKALPPAQRLRQRDIAAAVGASQATISRRTRDADASDVDLEESAHRPAGVFDPDDAGQEGSDTPPSDPSTQTAAEGGGMAPTADGAEGDAFPPEDAPAPAGGVEVPPPVGVIPEDSPVDEGSAGDGGAGPLTGTATQDSPVAAASNDQSALVAQQPGLNHPHRAAGEAPAAMVPPAGAGAQPSDLGEASGDETAEGLLASGPSAVDSEDDEEPLIESPEELKTLIDEWLAVLDERIEYAALAPLYDEDSLLDLELQLEGFARVAGLMRMWKERS